MIDAGRGDAETRGRGEGPSPRHRVTASPRLVLGTVVGASTVLRFYLARHYFGFLTGDDVEIISAALRRAAGLDYSPWQVRNLLVPNLIVAPLLAAARALGVGATESLVFVANFPFILVTAVNALLVYSLARKWIDQESAVVAAALYGFHAVPLVYGSAAYPRTISTLCVMSAALLALHSESAGRALVAGLLMSVAFATRYSEAIYLLPLFILCRSFRRLASLAGGFLAGSLLTVGLYDWMTWGKPFSSLIMFAEFTLAGQSSSGMKVQPMWWYLGRLHEWVSPAAVPLLWVTARKRVAQPLWWFVALPVLALSLIFHKEVRYLHPVLPLLAILTAAGFSALMMSGYRAVAIVLLALTFASQALGTREVQKRSMAAVVAARDIAASGEVRSVALAQAWAYGARIYLGNDVGVMEIPANPTRSELDAAASHADLIALYQNAVTPEQRVALARQGFAPARVYRWGRSRPVVIFTRSIFENRAEP